MAAWIDSRGKVWVKNVDVLSEVKASETADAPQ